MRKLIVTLFITSLAACGGGDTSPATVDAWPNFDLALLDTTPDDTPDTTLDAGADAATDAATDSPAPDMAGELLPGCAPGDGCFGDPCDEGSDCLSGWCVEHLGDGVCTQTCEEECPAGWTCQQVSTRGPDLVFVCVSDFANLCKPCEETSDCVDSAGTQDVCVDYGSEGSFCGGACDLQHPCPAGYVCAAAVTVDSVPTTQCVLEAGVCNCSTKAIALALWTSCESTNVYGTCEGTRACTQDGLTDCDAQVPAAEACNGKDDNCDGFVDEELCDDSNPCTDDQCVPGVGCEHTPLDGIPCAGTGPCPGEWFCDDGECVNGGDCSPGETQSQDCGNCGSQTRSCSGQCTWGTWGDCQDPCSCECTGGICCSDGCNHDPYGTSCGDCKQCNGNGSCSVNMPDGTSCGGGDVCYNGACKDCLPGGPPEYCDPNCGTFDGPTDGYRECSSSGTWGTCMPVQCEPNGTTYYQAAPYDNFWHCANSSVYPGELYLCVRTWTFWICGVAVIEFELQKATDLGGDNWGPFDNDLQITLRNVDKNATKTISMVACEGQNTCYFDVGVNTLLNDLDLTGVDSFEVEVTSPNVGGIYVGTTGKAKLEKCY